MNEIINNANIQELKFLVVICGCVISFLLMIVGFFITRGISKSAKSLESMANDIGQIKLTVMHVDTKHNELEKRVNMLENDRRK